MGFEAEVLLLASATQGLTSTELEIQGEKAARPERDGPPAE